jgi:hypothetical protein
LVPVPSFRKGWYHYYPSEEGWDQNHPSEEGWYQNHPSEEGWYKNHPSEEDLYQNHSQKCIGKTEPSFRKKGLLLLEASFREEENNSSQKGRYHSVPFKRK